MSATPPIKGYRQLEPAMVDLANKNKLIEELTLRQLDKHLPQQMGCDQRLVAMARSYLQVGFMLLNRSVFQPTRIEGEIDVDTLIKELVQ